LIDKQKERIRTILSLSDVSGLKKYPGLRSLGNPVSVLREVLNRITQLTQNLSVNGSLCEGESVELMVSRWKRLVSAYYDPQKDEFDTSKIP
jgi:hypothetical protein